MLLLFYFINVFLLCYLIGKNRRKLEQINMPDSKTILQTKYDLVILKFFKVAFKDYVSYRALGKHWNLSKLNNSNNNNPKEQFPFV